MFVQSLAIVFAGGVSALRPRHRQTSATQAVVEMACLDLQVSCHSIAAGRLLLTEAVLQLWLYVDALESPQQPLS